MTTQAENVMYVWRRNLERKPSRWVWWVIAVIVALAAFGAFAAFMAETPEEIQFFVVFGGIASVLVWSIPRVYAWGRRRNPDITMEGRELVWAKKRVPIDQVERWSASLQTSYHRGASSTFGAVKFQLMGERKRTTFIFAHLDELELAELIAAIDPVLPGRRVELL